MSNFIKILMFLAQNYQVFLAGIIDIIGMKKETVVRETGYGAKISHRINFT